MREWGRVPLLWKSSVALPIPFVIYTFLNAHLAFFCFFSPHQVEAGERCAEGVRDTLAGRQTQRLLDVNY